MARKGPTDYQALIKAARSGTETQELSPEKTQNLSSSETKKLEKSATQKPRAVKAVKGQARAVPVKAVKPAPMVVPIVDEAQDVSALELRPFGTNLHPDLIRRLKMRAATDGRKVREIVAEVLEAYLKGDK
jgi:hypothetical protein